MTRPEPARPFRTADGGVLRGPWLGQPAPSAQPVEFCPEIYSTKRHTFCTAFSPAGDELFFATENPSSGAADLAWMRMQDGIWREPRPGPFNSAWTDNDICMSPDGSRVCWRSWRPLPGRTEPEERSALWASDRTKEGWGEPFPVECAGETQFGGYPGIARRGSVYFAGRRTPDECCVYRASPSGRAYEAREPVLCGMTVGGDLCIAPDESFLIIACWHLPENNGESDLYVSFRLHEGRWSSLRNLGTPINSELNENCPMLSSDGKRFFFFRCDPRNKVSRTFWVDASIVERLRPDPEA